MEDILRCCDTLKRDPRIEARVSSITDPFRLMTRKRFEQTRGGGDDEALAELILAAYEDIRRRLNWRHCA